MPNATRQLAAIMFTDIVGYTATMGKDSDKALELVRQSKQIQKPVVEKHNGTWLKEMGDGAMAQFSSALDAVNCTLEIQRNSRADFEGDLRIGIHLGDITIENNDVYGDGVNVAARLESIADPGGIYISESVEKAIRGQSDIQAKYLGEVYLKNVDYGVRTYALQGVGLPIPDLNKEKGISGRFIAEIRRRGVIRAGITYLLVSLLLIVLIPATSNWITTPESLTNKLITLLLIGFPIAVYLAWRYERSPEGFVRSNSAKSWQNPLPAKQRKPLTGNILIGSLALIVVILYFYSPGASDSTSMELTVDNAEVDKSIAILPFKDLSPEGDKEYFSFGMMEEILNHLYKIRDLRVTSRTSSMSFRNSSKTIQEIGKELGVAHILDGSVRTHDDKIRITVQLIDVETDAHIWVENFDRDLNDIFKIQSEIATRIASQLQAEIRPMVEEMIFEVPTQSIEAYELYLQATNLANYTKGTLDSDRAIKLLNKAIKLDPDFANAYLTVGIALLDGATYNTANKRVDPFSAWIASKPYFQKAIDLDPNNGFARRYMAMSLLWFEWDFDAARLEFEKAREIFPNENWVDYLVSIGQFEEAVINANNYMSKDRTDPFAWSAKFLSEFFIGNHSESSNTINELIQDTTVIGKEFAYLEVLRVWMYLEKYNEVIYLANELSSKYPDHQTPPRVLSIVSISHYHSGNVDESGKLLEKLIELSSENAGGSPSFYAAMVYSQMGEIDKAFSWLEKSYADHEVEMYWLKVEPPFYPLHNDTRWQEMLDKIGFPD